MASRRALSTKPSSIRSGGSPLVAGAVLLAGCDALTLDREPEVAHVELDSPDVSRIALVISQWFIEVEGPECEVPGDPGCLTRTQLVEADTSTVSLPFSESYPFDLRLQFYAEAFTNPPVEATIAMKVYPDDEEWYNDSRLLPLMNDDGVQETIKFQCHHLRLPGGCFRLYSDLLLHDMGPQLASSCTQGTAPSEWNTARLVSLGHRSEFLHDGRVQRIRDAIELHGGEADGSRDIFRRLNQLARDQVLAFLRSL